MLDKEGCVQKAGAVVVSRAIQVFDVHVRDGEFERCLREAVAAGVDPEWYFLEGLKAAYREARRRHVDREREERVARVAERHAAVDRNMEAFLVNSQDGLRRRRGEGKKGVCRDHWGNVVKSGAKRK